MTSRASTGHASAKRLLLYGAVVVASVAFLGGSSSARAAPRSRDGEQAFGLIRRLVAEAGLPEAWGDFFVLVAWGESRGNPASRNEDPGEADAAATAYERNRDRFAGCGHAPSAYTFGSAGLFGFLPANGLAQLGEDNRCLSPESVTDPRISFAMAVGFARGLMRWDRFAQEPTWLNLRLMWGSPRKGGDREALRKARDAFADDLAAVGLPPAWLDGHPPQLPVSAAEVLTRLGVP